MINETSIIKIEAIVNDLRNGTKEEKAVCGILNGLLGAIHMNSEMALLNHSTEFTQQQMQLIKNKQAEQN